jgi:hypothetical protein
MMATRCALLLVLAAAAVPTLAHAAKAEQESRESKVLEATTIEGQILFPKVLFISAEDQARYPETLHRSYLHSAFEIASSAPLPKTICAPEPEDAAPAATEGGTTNENVSTNPQVVNP